jgi:hypothetical protein
VQLVFHFVPHRGIAQRPFHALRELGARYAASQAQSKRHVVEYRHWKRRRLLKHHANPKPQGRHVNGRGEDVLAVEANVPCGAVPRIKGVHPVEHPQERRFAAAGRPDEGGDAAIHKRQVDVLQRLQAAVIEIKVPDLEL